MNPTEVVRRAARFVFRAIMSASSRWCRVRRAREEAARRKFPDAVRIDSGALFFGRESSGAAQMRGNGTLIFTPAELVFEQWVVDREFRIPYGRIESLETPRSFLGKTQGVKLTARARIAKGEERARLFRRGEDVNPMWNRYQRQTTRELPVVVFDVLA